MVHNKQNMVAKHTGSLKTTSPSSTQKQNHQLPNNRLTYVKIHKNFAINKKIAYPYHFYFQAA